MSRLALLLIGGLIFAACADAQTVTQSLSGTSTTAAEPPTASFSPLASLSPAVVAPGDSTTEITITAAEEPLDSGTYFRIERWDGQTWVLQHHVWHGEVQPADLDGFNDDGYTIEPGESLVEWLPLDDLEPGVHRVGLRMRPGEDRDDHVDVYGRLDVSDSADHTAGATTEGPRVQQLRPGVWRHAPPQWPVEQAMAEVVGILRFDGQCGAQLETVEGRRYRILWPAGTEILSAEPLEITLPDGQIARPGDELRGAGGFIAVPEMEPYAGDCGHDPLVAVFNATDRPTVEAVVTPEDDHPPAPSSWQGPTPATDGSQEGSAAPVAITASTGDCPDDTSCDAVLRIDGRVYSPSCALVDPTVVTDQVYGTGEGYVVNMIEGVDPAVLLAWDAPGQCGPPLEGRWHAMLAPDTLGTPAWAEAWCRASLNEPDPAEGPIC